VGRPGHVSLSVYAVDGSYVASVHDGPLDAGPHTFAWDGRNRNGRPVASGIYVVELRAPGAVRHTNVNLLK
jgi:flagellar hook assembly protein FlgD